jgi:uncharacterized protein (DUF1330 family)
MTDEKIYMLNVLWFKKDGGALRYAEYAAAAAPFVAELGAKLVDSYAPDFALIGEWDPDLFFVVEWPSWDAFTKLAGNAGYQRIAHLREEALDKSLLLRCRRATAAPPNQP